MPRPKPVPAGKPPEKRGWFGFKSSKAEYTFIGVVVAALGFAFLLLEIPGKLGRFASPSLELRNELGEQTPFYVDTTFYLPGAGYSLIRWNAAFEITNLSSTDLGITDFDVDLPPVTYAGVACSLERPTSRYIFPIEVETFGNAEELKRRNRAREDSIIPTETLPVVLKAREKRLYVFRWTGEFQCHNNRLRSLDVASLNRVLIAAVANRQIDRRFFCGPREVLVRIHTAPGGESKHVVHAMALAPGCYIGIPVAEPASGDLGEPFVETEAR